MFGYITPDVSELKVKEYGLFRAYYCGLCRELKKNYGICGCLNYDAAFIYMLNDALNNAEIEIETKKCALHPAKGKPAAISDYALYAADMNIIMAYYKLKDDALDGKKFHTKIMLKSLSKKFERAKARRSDIAEAASEMWARQQRAESLGIESTDEAAEPYAELFGTVLKNLNKLYECQLYDLGYALGRWVYLIDAYDDIEADLKSGVYNVYIKKYGIINSDAIPEDIKTTISNSLFYTLSRASAAFESLDVLNNRLILSNIINLGLKSRTKNVLEGFKGKETDGSLPRFRR